MGQTMSCKDFKLEIIADCWSFIFTEWTPFLTCKQQQNKLKYMCPKGAQTLHAALASVLGIKIRI